jgi:hypothetical protein
MKKGMLCVLALAMVGVSFDRAEAQGRRGRSRGWSRTSEAGYWGGGMAPGGVTAGGTTVPATETNTSSALYRIDANNVLVQVPAGTTPNADTGSLYRLEGNLLVQVTTTPSAGPATGVVQTGLTVQPASPPLYYPPPIYYPAYGPSSGGFMSGYCRGGG